jgi:crotonobetainyl-CoA:carnitine CoA-transferase CaiB-like acyl-CoA transferase
MMESMVPEFDRLGLIREREGSKLTGIVPTNTYKCRDDLYVIIGGNGDSIFKRLMTAAGRADMALDPEFASNADRVRNEPEVDAAISAWTQTLTSAEVVAKLEAAQVPVGSIYTVRDIVNDPHYNARGMFEEVEVLGRPLKIPAMSPKLSGTPGGTEWPGPAVGSHSVEILKELLGKTDQEIEALKAHGTI